MSSSTMTMGSSRCPGARREYCLSLCLVKPVVKTRPFLRKMAREALLPSCATASSSMSPVLRKKGEKIVKTNMSRCKKFVKVPWIYSSDFPILASEEDLWAIPIPASWVHQIRKSELYQSLTGANIPNCWKIGNRYKLLPINSFLKK